jgi:EpsI family protein
MKMNSVALRLYIVVAIVAASYGVSRWLQAAVAPPEIEFPSWDIRQLPMQLDVWKGEETELDPSIAAATGADVIVNRLYQDDANHTATLHFARFPDPAEGVYHNPLNCYRSSGWEKLGESMEDVKLAGNVTVSVCVTKWRKENETVIVAYWFQLGRHMLYERFDLGKVRWAMGGNDKWPVLFKVMTQFSVTGSDDTQKLALDFSQKIAEWLNQPEHRKYLDRWGGS